MSHDAMIAPGNQNWNKPKMQLRIMITFYASYGNYLGRISVFLSGLTGIYLFMYSWFGKRQKKSALIRL
jgi:hypothetical protein